MIHQRNQSEPETIEKYITDIEEEILEIKEPETVVLQTGKTLRILAEEKYGNREFWIYIYLKNKHKIPNPNVVPSDIELLIPHASEYGIDANCSESVQKAKKLGDAELS